MHGGVAIAFSKMVNIDGPDKEKITGVFPFFVDRTSPVFLWRDKKQLLYDIKQQYSQFMHSE